MSVMAYSPPHKERKTIAANPILSISLIQILGFILKSIHKLAYSSKELSSFPN
jgi:hypothetical protein